MGDQQEDGTAEQDGPGWDMRPPEPVIQSRDHEADDEKESGTGHHALLGVLLLLAAQPLLQQVRRQEIQRQAEQRHGDEEKSQETPSAAPAEGARRQEQEQEKEGKAGNE